MADSERSRRRKSARSAAQSGPGGNGIAPELLEGIMDDPEDAAVSPVAGQEAPENATGGVEATSANLSARRRAGTLLPQARSAARPGTLAVPEIDLTRQIDQSDMTIPKIRISQAMSKTNTLFSQSRGKEGVPMGSWYHSTTNQNLGETIYFIPVDMRKSRAMFVQGQGLVCRSFDLLRGEGNPGILCEGTPDERIEFGEDERGCALRLWERTPTGNTPPKCGITYSYPGLVIVDIDNPEESQILQGLLQLRSTAIASAAKPLNTAVMTTGGGVWHSVIMEISIETKTNTRGTFFVPHATFYDLTDSPEYTKIFRQARGFAAGMGGRDLRRSMEADDTDAF